jgi:stearoyl-CoA desaturase (Delta-9 desaturase)
MPSMHLLLDVGAALVAAFVVTQTAIFATTVYLHRGLTHRALSVHPIAELPFRFVVWITTGQRPREWVAVHRKHHAATDTTEDPHSPAVLGLWRVQFGNVGLYRRAAADETNIRKYARDIRVDWLDRAAFDHAVAGLAVGIAILVATMWALGFSLWVGFTAAGVHALAYVMLAGAINGVAHTVGRRPFKNSATNLWSLAVITGGEGFHNNHHAAPTSARFSFHWWQLDPGWWMVRVLAWVRLVRIRHKDVHLMPSAA